MMRMTDAHSPLCLSDLSVTVSFFFVLPFDKIYIKMKGTVKSISYLVNRKARAMHGNSFMHFYGTGLV